MKSNRAYVMLYDTSFPVSDEEGYDEYIDAYDVVTFDNASSAVEIAEEEMIEKAGRLFAESCEMYAGNGKCLEGGECENCDRIKKFKQKLME